MLNASRFDEYSNLVDKSQEFDMVIKVISEFCTSCGTCTEVCPVGAIHLADQQAVIDDELCTQCEACVDACPNGAVTSISLPLHNPQEMALAATPTNPVSLPTNKGLQESVNSKRSLAPVAGAALAFLGSEVAPRLIDLLMTALERKFVQTEPVVRDPLFIPSRTLERRSKGIRRQTRHRGGCATIRNQKERR